jgi:hypothetical protein
MEQVARAIKDLQKRMLFLEHLERPRMGGESLHRVQFVAIKDLKDNVATSVATITTTNETGNNDAGGYAVAVHLVVFDGTSAGTDTATKGLTVQWARAMEDAGTGVNSAVVEDVETASAATTPAQRDIGTLTVSLVETSEYIIAVQVTADHTGAAVDALWCVMSLDLLWHGFLTAPVIANA